MDNDEEQVTQPIDKHIDGYLINHSTTQINDGSIMYLGD